MYIYIYIYIYMCMYIYIYTYTYIYIYKLDFFYIKGIKKRLHPPVAKCPHGKRKCRCKECGGSSLCEHGMCVCVYEYACIFLRMESEIVNVENMVASYTGDICICIYI
jgi:hypothetical protein